MTRGTSMDNETQRLIEIAARAGAREYAAMQKKDRQKKIIHNTYALMESYVALKKHTTTAVSEASQVGTLSGSNEYLQSIRSSKVKTALMIIHIDESLKELKKDFKRSGESYKYDAFYMKYIDGLTYEQIQTKLNCGKNSPSNWCKEVMKKLSVKLFGIDGVEKW